MKDLFVLDFFMDKWLTVFQGAFGVDWIWDLCFEGHNKNSGGVCGFLLHVEEVREV